MGVELSVQEFSDQTLAQGLQGLVEGWLNCRLHGFGSLVSSA